MVDDKKTKAIVASRLKFARELAGLTQSQVAKMLGLKRPAISEIEAGRRNVSAVELANFANIYGVEMSWLVDSDPEKRDPVGDKLQLAARELRKLKEDDLDRLVKVLASLRKREGGD